ncbi:MAG: hypothetical protein H6538_03860 [Bacteroidales bacterium]|nr:hypothetical protein [Bacteroidales bacterium]MCB8998686.1 hypothetical protein [Bacteroidales bacterium]
MKRIRDYIIAHRGESREAPENSLSAIRLAWQRGAKAVEIDIHLTLDYEIVVIHDIDTFRVSGARKKIPNSTLKELKELCIGEYMGEKWKDERIPLLSEVLETIPENGKIIIEIKSDASILEKLGQTLKNSSLRPSQVEIIAFSFKTLAQAKRRLPQYKMLWLLNLDYSLPSWLIRINLSRLIHKIKKHNLDGVDVWAGKILDKKFIETIKKNNLLIYAWTVDDYLLARDLINSGIDGITTNRASKMAEETDKLNITE